MHLLYIQYIHTYIRPRTFRDPTVRTCTHHTQPAQGEATHRMSLADVAEIVDTSLVNGHLTSLTFVALWTESHEHHVTNTSKATG
jgi:hypothetical protein